MKKTRKLIAAQHALVNLELQAGNRLLPLPLTDQEQVYKVLAEHGYVWDARQDKWKHFDKPTGAPETGIVDVRLRASTADIERAVKLIGAVLENNGFRVMDVSGVYPDDRHGVAVKARVYTQWQLPPKDE